MVSLADLTLLSTCLYPLRNRDTTACLLFWLCSPPSLWHLRYEHTGMAARSGYGLCTHAATRGRLYLAYLYATRATTTIMVAVDCTDYPFLLGHYGESRASAPLSSLL